MAKKKASKQAELGRTIIGLDDLARRAGTRIRRPVLIVCEGEKTEQTYFNALRRHYRLATVEVVIHGEGAGPLAVVERAIALADERRREAKRDKTAGPVFEEVWCVFDREAANEPKDFGQAIALAQANTIQLAISNPSFEYWYLLHFVESDRGFQNSGEVETELKRQGRLVGYEKHHDVFAVLRDRTPDAHDRAKRLYQRCCQRDNDLFPNPSTLVYKLVGGIIAMTPYRR